VAYTEIPSKCLLSAALPTASRIGQSYRQGFLAYLHNITTGSQDGFLNHWPHSKAKQINKKPTILAFRQDRYIYHPVSATRMVMLLLASRDKMFPGRLSSCLA